MKIFFSNNRNAGYKSNQILSESPEYVKALSKIIVISESELHWNTTVVKQANGMHFLCLHKQTHIHVNVYTVVKIILYNAQKCKFSSSSLILLL